MSEALSKIKPVLEKILEKQSFPELTNQLQPKLSPFERIPKGHDVQHFENRWALLKSPLEIRDSLVEQPIDPQLQLYENHIENFIGTVKVPLGLAGPLRVNGLFAQGDYYIPMATTEATLVASYTRGSQLMTEAGGCTAMLLNEGVLRTPGFVFRNLMEVGQFLQWVNQQTEPIKTAAESTTRFGELVDFRISVEGNHVYLSFEYTTGDASGQNMVTIATQAACDFIRAHCPIQPTRMFVDANMSGDKKASVQSFQSVRGKKVTVEVTLPKALVEKRLHTNPEELAAFGRLSTMGGILSGTLGVQGHYANALAAVYIACGQDAACVAESAVGATRFEVTPEGDLYATVTLPNLMLGTVGGGTGLPSQHACLEILGCAGPGKAKGFAEVVAALCLAGELSISGAFCAGDFTRAHQLLARGHHRKED